MLIIITVQRVTARIIYILMQNMFLNLFPTKHKIDELSSKLLHDNIIQDILVVYYFSKLNKIYEF